MIIKLDYKTNARIFTAKKKMKSILEDLYIKYYIVFSYFCSLPFFFEVHVYIYHIFYDYFKLFELGLVPSFKNFYWNHLYIIYTIKYFQTNTFLYTRDIRIIFFVKGLKSLNFPAFIDSAIYWITLVFFLKATNNKLSICKLISKYVL